MKETAEEWWERLHHDFEFTFCAWNCSKPVIAMIDAREALDLGLVSKVWPKDRLRAETLKFAKRMSLVALECLKWNKRAINNAYESMGLRPAMNYGLAACTLMDSFETPEYRRFDEIRRERGFKAALKWREEQFAKYL